MTWFNDYPHYLQEEEDALKKEGFSYSIDEVARSKGRLVITVSYPIGSEHHELICSYPASYPFFSPKVLAPTLPPGRHIDPYHGGLCLFENEQSVWDAHHDNLANTLKVQIPKILKAHESPEHASDIEGNVGYQVTGQIKYEEISVIFTDAWDIPDNVSSGEMLIKLTEGCNSQTPVSGFVDSFSAGKGPVQTSSSPLEPFYNAKVKCQWVKLDAPPASISDDEVLKEAIAICPQIEHPIFQKKGLDIVGLVFPEESDYHKIVFNWIFIIRRKLKKTGAKQLKKQFVTKIIRSDRYTLDNIQQRVPRLRAIADKNVLVIGAGALGSNVIWQLARTGVQSLTIIDYDIVQVGNIPRWLLGFHAVGRFKVEVIKAYLTQSFPGIKCTYHNFQVGIHAEIPVSDTASVDAHDFLVDTIQKSDLVIDCTAETNVSNYLSHLSNSENTPYIWATATQGGWGGIVGRAIPNITEGHWIDFSYLYANNTIPEPAAEEGSDIQPVGCFHPTFTGTGFDLDHVSVMATRLAVATLCQGQEEGYPDFDWDVGVLSLWDEQSGIPIAPRWEICKLEKHTGSRNEDFTDTLDK